MPQKSSFLPSLGDNQTGADFFSLLQQARQEKKSFSNTWAALAEQGCLEKLFGELSYKESQLWLKELLFVYPENFWTFYHNCLASEILWRIAPNEAKKHLKPLWEGKEHWVLLVSEAQTNSNTEKKGENFQFSASKNLGYRFLENFNYKALLECSLPYTAEKPFTLEEEFNPALFVLPDFEKWNFGLKKTKTGETYDSYLWQVENANLFPSAVFSTKSYYPIWQSLVCFWNLQFEQFLLEDCFLDTQEFLSKTEVQANYTDPKLKSKLPLFLSQTKEYAQAFLEMGYFYEFFQTGLAKALLEVEKLSFYPLNFLSDGKIPPFSPYFFQITCSFYLHQLAADFFSLASKVQNFEWARSERLHLSFWQAFDAFVVLQKQPWLHSYFYLEHLCQDENFFPHLLKSWEVDLNFFSQLEEVRQSIGKGKEFLSSLWILQDELKIKFSTEKEENLKRLQLEKFKVDGQWDEKYFFLPSQKLLEIFHFAFLYYAFLNQAIALEKKWKKEKKFNLENEATTHGEDKKISFLSYVVDYALPQYELKITLLNNAPPFVFLEEPSV